MTKGDYIDSELLSDLVSNSLKKYPENIKPDRLSWNARSLQEMEYTHKIHLIFISRSNEFILKK